MFRFLKNKLNSVFYGDVLNSILLEEEQLAKEWGKNFAGMYPENRYDPDAIRSHVKSPEPTYSEYILKRIWAYLLAMQRESRKIEEIQKLLNIEEAKLSPKQEKLLNHLRRKLSWHPTKFGWADPKFIDPVIEDSVKIEHGDFSEKRYSQLVKEVSKDEIVLWEHLIKVKNRMLKALKELTKPLEKEKRDLDTIMQKVDEPKNDRSEKQRFRKPNDEEAQLLIDGAWADMQRFRKPNDEEAQLLIDGAWADMSVYAKRCQIKHELAFFNRVREILHNIEKRLKETRPA